MTPEKGRLRGNGGARLSNKCDPREYPTAEGTSLRQPRGYAGKPPEKVSAADAVAGIRSTTGIGRRNRYPEPLETVRHVFCDQDFLTPSAGSLVLLATPTVALSRVMTFAADLHADDFGGSFPARE